MQTRGTSRTAIEATVLVASLGIMLAGATLLWPITIVWCALTTGLWVLVSMTNRTIDPMIWFAIAVFATWLIVYLFLRIMVLRRLGT